MTNNLITKILAILAIAALVTLPVSASSSPVAFNFLIGTDFLCSLDPSACPAVAMADNGDTVEITGSGSISLNSKSATGSGTFVHKDADGNVIGSGSWTAKELLSFHSYGSGSAQGLPEELWGGKAIILVHLVSTTGLEADAILWVDCLLGNKIPAGAVEGVRLNVQGLINFNHEVSGFTVFVRN